MERTSRYKHILGMLSRDKLIFNEKNDVFLIDLHLSLPRLRPCWFKKSQIMLVECTVIAMLFSLQGSIAKLNPQSV